MTPELIISLVSLVLSTACSMMTVFVTLKVGKLNNLEAIRKYQKKITPFELTFKDKIWFLELMKSGEFSYYDDNSKTIMKAWYKKLCQEELNKEQTESTNKQTIPLTKTKTSKTGRRIINRFPTLPTKEDILNSGISVEVVVPSRDELSSIKDLEEFRNQYNVDDIDIKSRALIETKFEEMELSFDELLESSVENNKDLK